MDGRSFGEFGQSRARRLVMRLGKKPSDSVSGKGNRTDVFPNRVTRGRTGGAENAQRLPRQERVRHARYRARQYHLSGSQLVPRVLGEERAERDGGREAREEEEGDAGEASAAVGGEEGVGPVADVMGRAAFDVRDEAAREFAAPRERPATGAGAR